MLVTCAECGREISDQASACPGCGAPASRSAPVYDEQGRWVSGEPYPNEPPREGVFTRNRGFGDILLFGVPVVLVLIVLFWGE